MMVVLDKSYEIFMMVRETLRFCGEFLITKIFKNIFLAIFGNHDMLSIIYTIKNIFLIDNIAEYVMESTFCFKNG